MPKFTVDLTVAETRAVARRYGWTDTIADPNNAGATIANPVLAKEFFRAWLPNFLADEIFARNIYEAAQTASAGVTRPTLPVALES